MQCLVRAVVQSTCAAVEGYDGRRFASTGRGASAAKGYYIKQRHVALHKRMRLAHEHHQLQRILAKPGAMEGNLDKVEVPLGVGAEIGRWFCAAIGGVLIPQVLFGIFD